MAFGMKHWLGAVGIGVALVSIMSLPPSGIEHPPFRPTMLPEATRLAALQGQAGRLNARLRIDHYMDTFAAATVSASDGLTFRIPPDVDAEVLSTLRARVDSQLATAGITAPKASLGVFVADPAEGTWAGVKAGRLRWPEYYWGRMDGKAYCFAVVPSQAMEQGGLPAGFLLSPSILGVCELVAKHGLPGPTLDRWLGETGSAFARTATPLGGPLPQVFRGYAWGLMSLLGHRPFFPSARATLALEQCWANEGVGCAEFVQYPPDPRDMPAARTSEERYLLANTPLSAVGAETPFGPVSAHMTADLAQQFGDARFEAFWKTDQPFAEGFESAFGTSLSNWSLEYLRPVLPRVRPGPNVTFDAKLSTILLLALSAIVGGAWAVGRRVA